MAIDASIGGLSSDSYSSVASADAYHADHLYAADWTGATTSNKEKALKMSTRILDERVDWIGVKNTNSQALRFPRAGATDPDGYAVETTEIPTALINATAEFARHLIGSDLTLNADGKGVGSVTVGSINVDFDKSDTADVLPSIVKEMLRGWGEIHTRSKFGVASIVRT
jgi:hypothetical protein